MTILWVFFVQSKKYQLPYFLTSHGLVSTSLGALSSRYEKDMLDVKDKF